MTLNEQIQNRLAEVIDLLLSSNMKYTYLDNITFQLYKLQDDIKEGFENEEAKSTET